MRLLAGALAVVFILGGCSAKQINETTSSITDDLKHFGQRVTEQH